MTDEIQKAIDISNLSDEQIFELYSDVVEWGELLAGCYCTVYNTNAYGACGNIASQYSFYDSTCSSSYRTSRYETCGNTRTIYCVKD